MALTTFAGGRVEIDVDAAAIGASGGTVTYYGRIITRRAGGTGIYTSSRVPWDFSVNGVSRANGSGASGWLYDWRNSSNVRVTVWEGTWTAPSGVVQNFSGWVDTAGYGAGSASGSVVGTSTPGGGSGGGGTGWPSGKPSFSYVAGAATTTVALGQPFTIHTNRAGVGGNFTIAYAFGGASGILDGNAGDSMNWTPPISLASQIPSAVSGTLVIGVTNNATGSYETNTINVTVPDSTVPTISSLGIDDDNPTVKSLIGAFVRGHSVLRATVNAAGVHGSTIRDSSFTIDGATVASGGVTPLRESGSRSVQASATDSRSRTTAATSSLTVLPYSDPNQSTQARRCNASGVLDDNGAYLRVDVNAAVQSLLVGGEQKNALTIRVHTRQVGTSTWASRNVVTPVGLTYNSNFVVSGGSIFDITKSYDVQVTVEDRLKSDVVTSQVSTAKILVDFDGSNGVGIGRYRQQGTLDVQGDTYTSGSFYQGTEQVVDVGDKATQAVADAGTDDTKYLTPKKLREMSRVPSASSAGRATTAATGVTNVTFPAGRFTQPPVVVAGRVVHPNVCVAYISAVTATGFSIQAFTIGGAQVAATVDWEAAQMTPTSATG